MVLYEVGGANRWLHQGDRREAFIVRRVGQPWREVTMRVAMGSWWARLVSTEEWPSDELTRIAIDDHGTLSVDYDGDPVLARIWLAGPTSRWRATLAWNARRWRTARVR